MEFPMRFSRLLKLSFVGTMLFSPAMAQEASKVHEEALRVLRSGTNQPAAAAPAAPASAAARRNESPAERNARMKAEAQQRVADRERQQAEKRRQFEDYVKERERLRSGAAPGSVQDQAVKTLREQTANPATTPTSVAPAPATAPATRPEPLSQPQPATAPAAPVTRPATPPQAANPPVEQRALEIVREQKEPTPVPVRENELAPRTLATPSQASRNNVEETHQKALEVLRQQNSQPATAAIQSAPAVSAVQPTPAPQKVQEKELKPSPELQRRLDEMNRELASPNARNAEADAAYQRELEQRALQMMQQKSSAPATATLAPAAPVRSTPPSTATTAPANNDARTREMLRRQDEQLRRQSSGLADSTPASRPAATPAPARSNASDPAAEARARELLRQQQQAVSNASAATAPTERSTAAQQPAAVRSTPPVATTPAPARTAPPAADVDYSKDLENRARQSILERSQPQQAQAQAAATTASSASADPLHSPLTPNPEVEQVHARAMETLTQVQPGEGGQTRFKSKQERLQALNELYRADRLTPAEYHQRRAALLAEPNK